MFLCVGCVHCMNIALTCLSYVMYSIHFHTISYNITMILCNMSMYILIGQNMDVYAIHILYSNKYIYVVVSCIVDGRSPAPAPWAQAAMWCLRRSQRYAIFHDRDDVPIALEDLKDTNV